MIVGDKIICICEYSPLNGHRGSIVDVLDYDLYYVAFANCDIICLKKEFLRSIEENARWVVDGF